MIYFPHKSDAIFTRRNSKLIIACCWLVPFLMLIPSTSGLYGRHGLECASRSCTIMPDDRGRSPKDLFLFMGLALPCAVLIVTNAMIWYKVKATRRHMETQMQRSSTRVPRGLKEREQKLTKMMAFIFACFLATYMPGVIIKLVRRGRWAHHHYEECSGLPLVHKMFLSPNDLQLHLMELSCASGNESLLVPNDPN